MKLLFALLLCSQSAAFVSPPRAWRAPALSRRDFSPRARLSAPVLGAATSQSVVVAVAPTASSRGRAPAAAAPADGASSAPPGAKRPVARWLPGLILGLLCLQNAGIALLTRWTRTNAACAPYSGASVALVQELVKFPIIFAAVLLSRDGGARARLGELRAVLRQTGSRATLLLGVPALCYAWQNVLFFTALSNLAAPTYQVLSQTKTLFTAAFVVALLDRQLRKRQWAALVVLSAGIGLVNLSEAAGAGAGAGAALGAAAPGANFALGLFAVVVSSLLSAFANVYFEKIVKTTAPSLWTRQMQLGVCTTGFAALEAARAGALAVGAPGGARAALAPLLSGYSPAVWAIVGLKALGGLLVAATVKYTDNILKNYATAVSILLTVSATSLWTATPPSVGFMTGTLAVLASVFMYSERKPKPPR